MKFAQRREVRFRRRRQLPFWAWGLTWNFIQHVLLWKFRLKMRTMVDMERIIWRTSKAFVFGNAYSTVLAVNSTYGPAWQRPVSDNAIGGVDPVLPGRLIQFGGQVTF